MGWTARMPRVVFAAVAAAGCGGPAGARPAADDPRAMTAVQTVGDTLIAVTRGDVPPQFDHRLMEEARIAPGADDTTLFAEVNDFVVDLRGRIWVYDGSSHQMFLFSPDGTLLRKLGREGGGPGEIRSNNGMVALGDGGIALWDAQNGRITRFDTAGAFLTSWPTPSDFSTSRGLVADRSGALYLRRPVEPPLEGAVIGRLGLVRVDTNGRLSDSLIPPRVDVPKGTYTVTRKTQSGATSSSFSSRFGAQAFTTWHRDGYWVAGNGARYEIALARASVPLVIRRELAPVSIDPAERDEDRERILFYMRRNDPDWTWNGPPIPETKAPLSGLFIGRDGRIWARIATPSARIPDQEVEVPSQPGWPVDHFRSPTTYEVFDGEGRFLGRISFERSAILMEADGNAIWVLERNADGLPAVVRYRIDPPLP